jgi:hypothetical protein
MDELGNKEDSMTRLQKDALREFTMVLFLATLLFPPSNTALRAALMCTAAFLLLVLHKTSGGPVALKPGPVLESAWTVRGRVSFALFAAVLAILFLLQFRGAPIQRVVQAAPFLLVFLLVLVWLSGVARRRPLIKPEHDEREVAVLKHAITVGYGSFWVVFLLWNVAGWMLSGNGSWSLPNLDYRVQVLCAVAIPRIVRSSSILWQEWRAER